MPPPFRPFPLHETVTALCHPPQHTHAHVMTWNAAILLATSRWRYFYSFVSLLLPRTHHTKPHMYTFTLEEEVMPLWVNMCFLSWCLSLIAACSPGSSLVLTLFRSLQDRWGKPPLPLQGPSIISGHVTHCSTNTKGTAGSNLLLQSVMTVPL